MTAMGIRTIYHLCPFGLSANSDRHSGMRRPNSGKPEFGKYEISKSVKADLDGAGPESMAAMDSGFDACVSPRNDGERCADGRLDV